MLIHFSYLFITVRSTEIARPNTKLQLTVYIRAISYNVLSTITFDICINGKLFSTLFSKWPQQRTHTRAHYANELTATVQPGSTTDSSVSSLLHGTTCNLNSELTFRSRINLSPHNLQRKNTNKYTVYRNTQGPGWTSNVEEANAFDRSSDCLGIALSIYGIP